MFTGSIITKGLRVLEDNKAVEFSILIYFVLVMGTNRISRSPRLALCLRVSQFVAKKSDHVLNVIVVSKQEENTSTRERERERERCMSRDAHTSIVYFELFVTFRGETCIHTSRLILEKR
jgi:hypothetical protein